MLVVTLSTLAKSSNANEIWVTQVGDVLKMSIVQSGKDNEAFWTVMGNNNDVEGFQGSTQHQANIVNGDNNVVDVIQQGGGSHLGFVEIQGSDNTVGLYQSGDQGSHFGDIVLNGDDHSVTSIQKGNGAHSTSLELSNGGGAYTVNTTQDSTTNQTYSLTGTCTNTIGCTITITQY